MLTPASTVGMKRLYVDVIIGKSSISNVNDLLENFDIYACRASWNGRSASWLEAGATFRWSSRLHPLCRDLLAGFMQGWCDSDGRVDIYASKIEFLKSKLWRRAALTALKYAEKHYIPQNLVKIRARILSHASPHFFFDFPSPII